MATDGTDSVYAPTAGAKVEKGFHGLTGNENRTLYRQGHRTPTSYAAKSRMPKDYRPRISVPANKVPILLPEQVAAHEQAIQTLAQEIGGTDIPSLKPKINAHGNEYLPPENFSLNRPRNEKVILPTLELSIEEAGDIFNDQPPEELELAEGPRRENTHLAEILPAEKFTSNFSDSSAEGEPNASRSIIKKLPQRESNPSGLRGGSSTVSDEGAKKDLIRGKKIYSPNLTNSQQQGGWEFAPREERLLPSNECAVENSSRFLNSLTEAELALNAAKLESGFRIEDFARERGWSINFARRFQTHFNKKLVAAKQAAIHHSPAPARPLKMAASRDEAENAA